MTEDVPDLVLLLFFDHNILNIRKVVLKTSLLQQDATGSAQRYPSEINKSHPRLVVALQQG